MTIPKTRYAKNGGARLAYQIVRQGRENLIDLVVGLGGISHLEYLWDVSGFAQFIGQLAARFRVILFDNRGAGLSDLVAPDALPTTDERVQDIRAEMDAAGTAQAVLFGISDSGALAARFAFRFPTRTRALIVFGGYARRLSAPDYPWGLDPIEWRSHDNRLAGEWHETNDLDPFSPTSVAEDRRLWFQLPRHTNPGASRTMAMMNAEIDVRDCLPKIQTPTLILHRTGDRTVRIENGRYLADHIPAATLVELPGDNHLPFFGDQAAPLRTIEAFLERIWPARPSAGRVLASVLAVEVVGAAEMAIQLGDRRWGEVQSAVRVATREAISRGQGQILAPILDGVLAFFEEPAQALAAARSIIESASEFGLMAHGGVHAGELSTVHGDFAGIAVYLAKRIMTVAPPSTVLVSETIYDLVASADLEPVSIAFPSIAGLPGDWRLYRQRVAGDSGSHLTGTATPRTLASPSSTILSRREREVAALLGQGLTNREIADELVITVGTAERHVANILTKLGFRSRTQVAARAVEHGVFRQSPE